jgi:hypothetical protein
MAKWRSIGSPKSTTLAQVARLVGLRALDPEQKSKTKEVRITLNGNALTNDIVRKPMFFHQIIFKY